MLVLARKLDESITIGSAITITILGIRGSQVRVGVEAPEDTSVHRTEVYRSIMEENIKAAKSPDALVRIHSACGPVRRRD